MKARIEQQPRCVLLWRIAPGTAAFAAVEHAARPYGLRVRPVSEQDLNTTVGDLCRGRHAPAPGTAPTGLPAMSISGLRHDNGDLTAFLEGVRRGGAPIPLRAMVTPTSRSWTLGALLEELCQEHTALEDKS